MVCTDCGFTTAIDLRFESQCCCIGPTESSAEVRQAFDDIGVELELLVISLLPPLKDAQELSPFFLN